MAVQVDSNRIEVVDPVVADILRHKTPGERMRLALESNDFVRAMMKASLLNSHPDWSDDQVRDEICRRVLGDAIRTVEACR